MQLDRLPDLLTEQVGRVRDRTAEAVSSDDGSVLRELSKLSRKLDGTHQRLDELVAITTDTASDLDDLSGGHRTTWPRRLFWITVGLGAGAVAAYLADPDRGEQRRQEIVGQTQTRVRSTTEDVSGRAREVKDEVIQRAQAVKEQAVSSARSVAEQAQHAAEDVAAEAQHAVVDVRDEAQDAAEGVKDQVSGSSGSDGVAASGSQAPTPPPTSRP